MRTMKMCLLASVSTVAMLGAADAADLSLKAPSLVSPAPISTWTGFYIGGSAGAALHDAKVDYSAANTWDTDYNGNPLRSSSVGGLIGGQVGYNYQIRSAVFGIEGDYNWLGGLSATTTGGWPDCGATSCLATGTTDATGFASVRGRFGFDVMNGTLIYGTAGIGWVKIENNFNVTGTALKGGNFVANTWAPAFVAGGGIEQMIDNHWSVRGEVLWAKTESQTARATDVHYFDATTPPVQYDHSLTFVRFGVNYRF